MKYSKIFKALALLTLTAVLLTGCARPERRAQSRQETVPPAQTAATETVAEPEAPETQALELPKTPEQSVQTETLPRTLDRNLRERTMYTDSLTPLEAAGEKKDARQTSPIPENLRIRYGAGSGYRLEGNPYVLTIFLDDDVSSWNEDKVHTYLNNLINPGLEFIEESAANWGVDLEFGIGYYATYGHPHRPVKYNGTVGTNMDGNYSRDILEQAAQSLGFDSREHMHQRIQEHSGQDQVVYIIMLNKGGRSYSMSYDYQKNTIVHRERTPEYSVIYTGFTDDSGDTASDAIAHETLHLFGARDYYMPESRKALARKLYPKDIMLCDMTDLEYFDLGEVTAYSVGWTDEVPEILRDENWWS